MAFSKNNSLLFMPCMYNFAELTPEQVAATFYKGELENEIKRIGKETFLFTKDSDMEKCMEMVEEIRCSSIYEHEICTPDCRKRGQLVTQQQCE